MILIKTYGGSLLENFFIGGWEANASLPENPYIPTRADTVKTTPNFYTFRGTLPNKRGPLGGSAPLHLAGIRVDRTLTFFDNLLEDTPAYPSYYDGEYSFSTRPGAYHIIAGVVTDGQEDYAFFCAKRTHTTFVRITPPLTLKEAIQITSREAKFWVSNPPGSTLVESGVPDEYCKYGLAISSGEGGVSRFLDFSYQVFKDWVSFSGRTSEPSRVEVTIKRIETMEVVKTLSTDTSGPTNTFYLATSLRPGDYTYEACAYPLSMIYPE